MTEIRLGAEGEAVGPLLVELDGAALLRAAAAAAKEVVVDSAEPCLLLGADTPRRMAAAASFLFPGFAAGAAVAALATATLLARPGEGT